MRPVTIPLVEPTVATVELLLLQVPPADASVSVVEEPMQYTAVEPPIVAGSGLTVKEVVAIQPVGIV